MMGMPDSALPAEISHTAGKESKKAELLEQLRDLSSTIRELDGDEQTPQLTSTLLPKVVKDKRGRSIEVWDQRGRQYSFFFARECAYPYAYEIRDSQRRDIEKGSVAGSSNCWAIYHSDAGLSEVANNANVFAHQVVRVEITPEGAMLANASDGYQLRRDPTGDEFEAFYDCRGCLVEATRRGKGGVERTTWNYDPHGNTVATEYKADGSVIESKYDSWGRMLSRLEQKDGTQILTTTKYHQDGSYLVWRQDGTSVASEERRRKDGTMEHSKSTNHTTCETITRTYDKCERLCHEERCTNAGSDVTRWRYGEDGWTEVSQNSSDGRTLHVRYDNWGRLVMQQETTNQGTAASMFVYKPDGSYHVKRKTAEGIETQEYYRPNGTRQYSSARSLDGQVVEVDYDSTGRPLKRTRTTVRQYQVSS